MTGREYKALSLLRLGYSYGDPRLHQKLVEQGWVRKENGQVTEAGLDAMRTYERLA